MLITRPAEDAAPTAARLAALGWEPVIAPVMQVRRCATRLPKGVQAIVTGSGNALAGLPAAALPLLAVGDATADKARGHGFADVRSARGDAAALIALAARELDPRGGALLVAAGSLQGHALCAGLRAQGFRVIRRVTYAVTPVRALPAAAAAAFRAGTLDSALFLSGETAAAFVRLVPPALHDAVRHVRALAIGNRAADALHALPWRQVLLAAAPTLDDVLALL